VEFTLTLVCNFVHLCDIACEFEASSTEHVWICVWSDLVISISWPSVERSLDA